MKSPRVPTIILSLLPLSTTWAFLAPSSSCRQHSQLSSPTAQTKIGLPTLTQLSAKNNKKKRRSTSGEGFGKSSSSPEASTAVVADAAADTDAPRALQSIDNPTSLPQTTQQQLELDPNLSPEDRSKAILKQKFGLKSYEEQQADLGDYRAVLDAEKKAERRDKLRNVEKLWPEDKDFIALLPPGLIRGVDTFLKLGLGVSTTAFILAGILITIEAGSKATGYELPGGLEELVLNVVQPNFTPGLGVLLGFSVSLGLFSVALGGSASSTYREKP